MIGLNEYPNDRYTLQPVLEELTLSLKRDHEYRDVRNIRETKQLVHSGRNKKTYRSSARSGYSEDLTEITQMDGITYATEFIDKRYNQDQGNKFNATYTRSSISQPLFLLTYDNSFPESDKINNSRFPKMYDKHSKNENFYSKDISYQPDYGAINLFLNHHDHNAAITSNVTLLPPETILQYLGSIKRQTPFQTMYKDVKDSITNNKHNITKLLRIETSNDEINYQNNSYSYPDSYIHVLPELIRKTTPRSPSPQSQSSLRHSKMSAGIQVTQNWNDSVTNRTIDENEEEKLDDSFNSDLIYDGYQIKKEGVFELDERKTIPRTNTTKVDQYTDLLIDKSTITNNDFEVNKFENDENEDISYVLGSELNSDSVSLIIPLETDNINSKPNFIEPANSVKFQDIPKKVPILPPDLMDDIRLDEKKTVKHFLSTKSITEDDWINMRSDDVKNNEIETDRSKRSERDYQLEEYQNFELQNKHFDNKQNKVESKPKIDPNMANMLSMLKIVEDRIKSVDHLSLEMERRMTEVNRTPVQVDRAHWVNDTPNKDLYRSQSKNKKTDQLELHISSPAQHHLVINDKTNILPHKEHEEDSHSQSKLETYKTNDANETMKTMESNKTKNDNDDIVSNVSHSQSTLINVPKLNFNTSINSIFTEGSVVGEGNSIITDLPNETGRSVKSNKSEYIPKIFIQNKKNRLAVQRKNNSVRKMEAMKFFKNVVCGTKPPEQDLTLCATSRSVSSTQQDKLFNYIRQQKQRELTKRGTITSNRSINHPSYKPIFRNIIYQPFDTKVKLQNPKTTRHYKPQNKPKTYSQQLKELQPKKNGKDTLVNLKEYDSAYKNLDSARTMDTEYGLDDMINGTEFSARSASPSFVNWSEVDNLLRNASLKS